jgi:ABC-type Fe3+-siderophore transport system permease subunit
MILITIGFIFSIIWIAICYHLAKKNGRNVFLAILAGLLLGIFGVILYLLLGETDKVKTERIKKVLGK